MAERFETIDDQLGSSFAQIEQFNDFIFVKRGPLGCLLRDRGYRACAAVWLDAINELAAACRCGDTVADLVRLPSLVAIGEMAVFGPVLLISKQYWELKTRVRAPPEVVAAQLEQQAAREQRRRAVLIELLQPHVDLKLELYERNGELRLLARALGEHREELRATPPSEWTRLGPLADAENRMLELRQTVFELIEAHRAFLERVQNASSVRVHDLDGRAGATLRGHLATLQLKMEALRSGHRNLLARHLRLLDPDAGPHVSSAAAAAPPAPAPLTGPEPNTEPAGAVLRQPAPVAALRQRSENRGATEAAASEANESSGKKGRRKKGGNRKGVGARLHEIARPAGAEQRVSVVWGNAADGLWDWVEAGIANRFRRKTLDSIVVSQFAKTNALNKVPGRVRSRDIPSWIDGDLGHHTLPRSNLVLFFLRHGAQVSVVGMGAHAHNRKRHNKDYNVFWWREAKGRAVGPKRLSLQS